ncbi:hypothetical protein [Thiorhodococcus minor]|uniref:Uncharacterized protein n=1 Tax=Thiorhodococcus minor TaxID=57489 RepID=A0A6M0K2Q3_9GAMM|nr:hypothetical protein [Thiorhodococcus minor]NEV64042.1 hypothetical protein [Thiorhodococcus minor]
MSRDVMLHIEELLDSEARQALLDHLEQRLGLEAPPHASDKPHLLFCAADPQKAPRHLVLKAVKEQGYQARLVDL